MSDFSFAQPALLWLLLAAPLLVIWQWQARKRRAAALADWLPPGDAALMKPRVAGSALLLTLLVLAAAGPTWGREQLRREAHGRDLLILLDVSRSMLAEDSPPQSRLARADRQLRDLFARFQQLGRTERVALIAFAGQARVLSPFTFDYDHVRYALAQARPELFTDDERLSAEAQGRREGSSLPAAFAVARKLLERDPSTVCDLLLVTDGDFAATPPPTLPGTPPLSVLAAGDGKKGWPIPTRDPEQPFLLEEEPTTKARQRVLTRAEPDALRQLAQAGGGQFVADEPGSLVAWWNAGPATQPGRRAAFTSAQTPLPRFGWLVAAAGLLLLLPLVRRPRPRYLGTLLPLAALLLVSSRSADQEVQGQLAFERGQFAAALAHYQAAATTTDDPGRIAFAQAAVLARLERWQEAAEAYRQCLEDAPGQRAYFAWYGRGTCLAHLGAARRGRASIRLLEDALRAFREAEAAVQAATMSEQIRLRTHSLDDLRHNQAEVEALLQQRRAAPPEPNDDLPEPPPPAPLPAGEADEGDGPGRRASGEPSRDPAGGTADTDNSQPGDPTPGAGQLPMVVDSTAPQSLRPDQAEQLLKVTLARLRAAQLNAGGGAAVVPANQRDW